MRKFTIRHILPYFIKSPLWGDRRKWGLTIQPQDSCWKEWQRSHGDCYNATQRNGIGLTVTDAGYRIMSEINLANKRVLEVGAGDIRHIAHWRENPMEYILADVSDTMMQKSKNRLDENNVPYRSILLQREQPLPLEDNSVDVIVSFYSLEHLYPLSSYLSELRRVLKPSGILIGAIPAEGGIAWGVGRMLTSRRWFKKNTTIDPDKIICWEHPNFADEIVVDMENYFQRQQLDFWPFKWLRFIDLNLVIKFVYSK